MRKHLTTAIEVISIFTAIGAVLSAFIYSIRFAEIGVNYMSVASLSDMLRDSVKLLILFFSSALVILPSMFAVSVGTRWIKSVVGKVILAITMTAILLGLIELSAYTAFAVGGTERESATEGIPLWLGVIGIAAIFLIFLLFLYSNTAFQRWKSPDPDQAPIKYSELFDDMSGVDYSVLLLFIIIVLCHPTYASSRIIMKQLEHGLLMKVELGEVESCPKPKSYTTVWIGDNKAVVRCETSKKYVVKLLS